MPTVERAREEGDLHLPLGCLLLILHISLLEELISLLDILQASHSGPNFRQKSEFRLLSQKWSEKSLILV